MMYPHRKQCPLACDFCKTNPPDDLCVSLLSGLVQRWSEPHRHKDVDAWKVVLEKVKLEAGA